MELATIPEKLEDFNIVLLNKLINVTSVESDIFDFKLEPSDLHEDICAMANTKGGFLVLGIDQITGKDGRTIVGFKKVGFKKGEEDLIGGKINNYRFLIEPIPTLTINHIYEDSGEFYTAIKIESRISDKPYFVTNTDQCFVRLHSSSQRVGRTTILNLFSASVEQKSSIEKLRVASGLVREALLFTSQGIQANATVNLSKAKLSPVDLTILRNAILSGEWFLIENDLLGKHTAPDAYTAGINGVLYNIELMNTYVKAYNQLTSGTEKESVMSQLSNNWGVGSTNVRNNIEILDKIIKTANEFLAKYH